MRPPDHDLRRALADLGEVSRLGRTIAELNGSARWGEALASLSGATAISRQIAERSGTSAFAQTLADITGSAAWQQNIADLTGATAFAQTLADITGSAAWQQDLTGATAFAQTLGSLDHVAALSWSRSTGGSPLASILGDIDLPSLADVLGAVTDHRGQPSSHSGDDVDPGHIAVGRGDLLWLLASSFAAARAAVRKAERDEPIAFVLTYVVAAYVFLWGLACLRDQSMIETASDVIVNAGAVAAPAAALRVARHVRRPTSKER